MSTPATAISTSPTIEPRRSSVSEVEEICKSGELERLIGIVEDRYIEFKLQLNIKQAEFKLKLAKSIASFANADGGILVIGVATTRDVQTRRDFAESLNYLEGTIDLGSYYKVLNSYLYPSIAVSIERYPLKGNPQQAVIAVKVERAGSEKPILVTETISEILNGGTIFGYFRRDEDGTNNVKRGEVHSLIQAGERLKEVGDLKDAINSTLAGIERIEKRLSRIEGMKGSGDGNR